MRKRAVDVEFATAPKFVVGVNGKICERDDEETLLLKVVQSAAARQPKVVEFAVSQSMSFAVTVMPSPPVMVAVRTPPTLERMVPSVRSVKRSELMKREPTPCMPVVVALPTMVEEPWEIKPWLKRVVMVEVGVKKPPLLICQSAKEVMVEGVA